MSESGATPTLAQFIQQTIGAKIAEIHTATPGIVVSYDRATQKADVQPCLKRKFSNGNVEALPIIRDVPIVFPRSKKCSLIWDLEKDDHVLLVFAERSLDNFIAKGGIIDPNDTRKHSLTDAIAFPGFWPDGNAVESEATALELKNDQAMLRLLNGKIYIGVSGSTPAEPVMLGTVAKNYLDGINQKLTAILDILIAGDHVLTTGAGSPTAPNPARATQFTTLKTQVEALKTNNLDNNAILSELLFTEKGT